MPAAAFLAFITFTSNAGLPEYYISCSGKSSAER